MVKTARSKFWPTLGWDYFWNVRDVRLGWQQSYYTLQLLGITFIILIIITQWCTMWSWLWFPKLMKYFTLWRSTQHVCHLVLLLSETATLGQPDDFNENYFSQLHIKLFVPNLALPPVGWHRTVEHPAHTTTDWAWLNTVVILNN